MMSWGGHLWQMQRLFQISFKTSHYCHYYTIGHIGGRGLHLEEENIITSAEDFLAVKTLKAAGCDDILPEMLKSLDWGVLFLIPLYKVAWCSRKAPKVWETGAKIPIHKKGSKRELTRNTGSMPRTSTHVLWKTIFLVKSFGVCYGISVFTADCYWRSSHCIPDQMFVSCVGVIKSITPFTSCCTLTRVWANTPALHSLYDFG